MSSGVRRDDIHETWNCLDELRPANRLRGMAPTPFSLQPVDETFFEDAPIVLRDAFEVPMAAPELWDELTKDDPLIWCRIIDNISWTSERPFGVGTTRTVTALKGLNVLDERFFVWEEGRRKSFYAFKASGPLFKRFAEDYLLEPTGEASCRFTWTIAYEPSLIGKAGAPVNKRLLGSLFADTRKHFSLA